MSFLFFRGFVDMRADIVRTVRRLYRVCLNLDFYLRLLVSRAVDVLE